MSLPLVTQGEGLQVATGWGTSGSLANSSSVLSPADLTLTYGFNYHLDSDDSQVYGFSLDLYPELAIQIFNSLLNTFCGMFKGTSNSK